MPKDVVLTRRFDGVVRRAGDFCYTIRARPDVAAPPIKSGVRRVKGRKFPLEDLKTEDAPPPRRTTGIAEFDRVTGGGLVAGSALLVGGDPGIGKSTLILQALGEYAKNGGHAVYISGEEAMAIRNLFACSVCEAKAGERCRDNGATSAYLHEARVRAAVT